jgi:hypothetical protein
MCAVLLPPGVNPIAVDKHIISTFIFPFYFFFFSIFNMLLIFLAKVGSTVGSNAVRALHATVCSLPVATGRDTSLRGTKLKLQQLKKPEDINPQQNNESILRNDPLLHRPSTFIKYPTRQQLSIPYQGN